MRGPLAGLYDWFVPGTEKPRTKLAPQLELVLGAKLDRTG